MSPLILLSYQHFLAFLNYLYLSFQVLFQLLQWTKFSKQTFNVLVDDHFSSSAVSESRFHDFGKIIYICLFYSITCLFYTLFQFYSFHSVFLFSLFLSLSLPLARSLSLSHSFSLPLSLYLSISLSLSLALFLSFFLSFSLSPNFLSLTLLFYLYIFRRHLSQLICALQHLLTIL